MNEKDFFIWNCGKSGSFNVHRMPQSCQFCGKRAMVTLPPPVLRRQPDKTNVVCHPSLGGCNHGFHMDGWPTNPNPPRPREPKPSGKGSGRRGARGSYKPRRSV